MDTAHDIEVLIASPPPPTTISLVQQLPCSHLPSLQCIQLGANIEKEIQLSIPIGRSFARVEIYDIFYSLAAPVNHPVMSVKGRSVTQERIDASFGRKRLRKSEEGMQTGATAPMVVSIDTHHITSKDIILLTAPSRFPLLDLFPRPLVDRIVDWHDGFHIRGIRLMTLALHGFEEHFLARINPVSG